MLQRGYLGEGWLTVSWQFAIFAEFPLPQIVLDVDAQSCAHPDT